MLRQELIDKFLHLTDNGKIKGAIAESGAESGVWLRFSQQTGDVSSRPRSLFDKNRFDATPSFAWAPAI